MKCLLLLLSFSLSAATLTSSIRCLGLPQQQGQTSCASSMDSASAVFTSDTSLADVRVDTWATNPFNASAWMIYEEIFNFTVSGFGSGYILPILTISYIGEPALTSEATAKFGDLVFKGSSTHGFGGGTYSTAQECYFCRIPVTFGQPVSMDLKLNVDSITGFALFPKSVSNAQSWAEASFQGVWVFNSAGQRINNPVTFNTEAISAVAVPEPQSGWIIAIGLILVAARRWGRQTLRDNSLAAHDDLAAESRAGPDRICYAASIKYRDRS